MNKESTRCAIYTRKSTDEGLDQDFNSLDAQRESAEAYIASQKAEGWVCLPERYDDGGFTGGNMDRPALKRLKQDIEEGRIDCVVVYKVDRLSRSLLDFSKIIELFDTHGVTFVSVTQHFNTTDSMGRLTLNILLSFAQFEREIIAERTRDKMYAARKKGKWVGGRPILGYDIDPQGGRLIVNEDEAFRVRTIYDLYLEHQALIPVVQELNRRGLRTKQWTTKKGTEAGGKAFTKNTLFGLLKNVTYIGKVKHKEETFEGEHKGIVEPEVWHRVQKVLGRNGRTGGTEVRNKYGATLKGLLYCEPCGTGMAHTYTSKNGKRYRYYVCHTAQQKGWSGCPTKSLPANVIESAVVEYICGIGKNDEVIGATLGKAREESESRMAELHAEQKSYERELRRLQGRIQKLAGDSQSDAKTDRLADLHDHVQAIEQRLTVIAEERSVLRRDVVDEGDLCSALQEFGPIWDSLVPREQKRIIRLLIERVTYDGRTKNVTVAFRSAGIKELCSGEAAQ